MQVVKTSHLTDVQKKDIIQLWNTEYPLSLKYSEPEEFDRFLAGLAHISHYLITNPQGKVIAWLATFKRDEERWFSILVNTGLQKQGLGTALLNCAKRDETELNGWMIDGNQSPKENGEIYYSPLQFYLKQQFIPLEDVRLETDKISAVKIRWVKNKN